MILRIAIESWMIGIPVFLIIFLFVWVSLKTVSFFGSAGNILISFCVAILCVISMFEFMSPDVIAKRTTSKYISQITPSKGDSQRIFSENPQIQKDRRVILLPYFVLMLTIIISVLIWLLAKYFMVCDTFITSSPLIRINKKYSLRRKNMSDATRALRYIRKNQKR